MITYFGRYNLLCKLGQGAMGSVFLARQKALKRFCAIKLINSHQGGAAMLPERFLREARAAASVSHPHLVNVFDCDQHDGQYFIAMEYIDGLTLGEVLRRRGALPLPLALHWLDQAAAAMECVHAKGIIHRDIKPDNMMVAADGSLKITDLGLAKSLLESEVEVTRTGAIMGTPHYVSPEQINDAKSADHRADIYSLGISFYHMVAGNAPYPGTSAVAICLAHMHQPMPSVNLPDAVLSQQLDALIALLTAKNRDQRLGSMTELRAILVEWLQRYPLDQASQTFCDDLDVTDRSVEWLLQHSDFDRTQIDSDPPPTRAADELAATIVNPPTAVTRKRQWPLTVAMVGVVVLALAFVGGLIVTRWNAARRSRAVRTRVHANPAPLPATPLVAAPEPGTPAPVPEPPLPSTLSPTNSLPAAPTTPAMGSVLLTVVPKDAYVLFQGKTKTPVNGALAFEDLAPGVYPLEVRLPGYVGAAQDVVISAGAVTKQHIELQRIPGRAVVESDPPGADVIVGGQLIGQTPATLSGGDGSMVNCVLRMLKYEDANVAVTLRETGTVERVQLARRPTRPEQPVVRTEQPQPVMGEPRLDRAAVRQKLETWLDKTRRTTAQRWQMFDRKQVLKEMEEFLKTSGMPASMTTPVSTQWLTQLDAAVNMRERDFTERRQELLNELVDVIPRLAGRGPRPDGPPLRRF